MGPSIGGAVGAEFISGSTSDQPMQTKLLLKAYSTGVSVADAVNSTIVPQNLKLVAIIGYAQIILTAAVTENINYEISLQSSSQFTTNDALNVVGYVGVAAPGANAGQNVRTIVNFTGMEIPMASGSRIYIHRTTSVAPASSLINLTYVFA